MRMNWKVHKDGSQTSGPWLIEPWEDGGVWVVMDGRDIGTFPSTTRAKAYINRINTKIVRAAKKGKQ